MSSVLSKEGIREDRKTQTTQRQPEILLDALRGQADIALAELRNTTTSRNPSIKGASREGTVRKFIRCFLPTSYAIGHGEIFSEHNERSRQVDVIIHDDIFSPVFKTADGGILVPCEAVYGTAEVKTRLDSNGWELAVQNIASVKRLSRPASELTDILPNRGLRLGSGLTVTGPKHLHNPYLGIVVGLKGLSADKIVRDLNDRMTRGKDEMKLLPDLVACVGDGHLIARYNKNDKSGFQIGTATLGNSYDGFRKFFVKDYVLSSLHLGMNVLLSGIRLKNRSLTNNWLDELLWVERKSQIELLLASAEQAGTIPAQGGWDAMESEARARGDEEVLRKIQDLRQKPPV